MSEYASVSVHSLLHTLFSLARSLARPISGQNTRVLCAALQISFQGGGEPPHGVRGEVFDLSGKMLPGVRRWRTSSWSTGGGVRPVRQNAQGKMCKAQIQYYLAREWMKRIDVEDMEHEYPLNSAWKITEDGFRKMVGAKAQLMTADGPVTWVIMQLNIIQGPPVKQKITLWNQTLHARTGGVNKQTVTIDIELLHSWHIERIDREVILVPDNEFLIQPHVL